MSGRVTTQILTVLGLILTAGPVAAQARLTGTVRDTTGAPIVGVEVSAAGVTRVATTDRAGAFVLAGIPVGTATVTARRLGYAPQSTIIKLVAGDNTMPDVVLTVIPRELDTVSTREQQLWRERPLLREFEENRKLGLGQFITRAEFAKNQGGFLSPMLDQKRGMVVVRGPKSQTWIGNKYVPQVGDCTTLEDYAGGPLSPAEANCHYCFPDVYLDYTKISPRRTAVNLGRFSPDMLEAMEIYLGGAETPIRYASGLSGCGVIVLHTRAVDVKPRRIAAAAQSGPTRSRFLVNASAAAGRAGATCSNCGYGSAFDGTAGYTLSDRWVVGGRYAKWTGTANGSQSLSLSSATLEWYPHPELARFKWFMNVGLGAMSVDLHSAPQDDMKDRFTGSGLPTTTAGTGVDVTLKRRFVITPFLSHSRNVSGYTTRQRCVYSLPPSGPVLLECAATRVQAAFTFTQLGTRIGWR